MNDAALVASLLEHARLHDMLHCSSPHHAQQAKWAADLREAARLLGQDAERMAAERERCAKPVPDEWLVKVHRLVQGFEHVSGIARLWEPDYSSGNERALWSRATEACADVAKLLREAEGPNAKLTGHQRPQENDR